MLFVPFTGIDNHNRCVTFGSGLLTRETEVYYKWLLETFQKCFKEDPKVVVTDQDSAMHAAIKCTFKKTRHRLCMWHIMRKVTTKVCGVVFFSLTYVDLKFSFIRQTNLFFIFCRLVLFCVQTQISKS